MNSDVAPAVEGLAKTYVVPVREAGVRACSASSRGRAIYGIDAMCYRRTLDERVGLLELGPPLQRPVRNLSLGERMKCELAVALAAGAFWFVRIENVPMIFWSMYQAGRWPVDIYPRWLRFTLTGLVPVALVIAFVSRWFWKAGLRRYSGASA